MIADTIKNNICLNKIVCKKKDVIVLEEDIIVPDIKPDILNTISTSGNICIYKKEILEEKIKIDGCVNLYLVYLADSEDGRTRAINNSIDFSKTLEIKGCKPDMYLDSNICIKNIECKVLNGRKVNVKIIVEINVILSSEENISMIENIENIDDIQKLNKNITLSQSIGRGQTKVYAKDTISIDNIDSLVEILSADINIINSDIKLSYNKVLVKSDANIKIIYLTEDNRICNIESNIPVMGFVDIPNISDDNICDVKYEIKNIMIKPNNMEEHSIYVEIEIEVICNAYENKQLEIMQDLYSPSKNINFKCKNIRTMCDMHLAKGILNIDERIEVEGINSSNKICDVKVSPEIETENILEGRIIYTGNLNMNIMYLSETGDLNVKNVKMPFEFNLQDNNIGSNYDIETKINILSQDFIVVNDTTINAKIEMEFVAKASKNMQMNIIDEIEVDERLEDNYSMVIYFVKKGETLWDIAKKFGSRIEDIVAVNDIENENVINEGQQLFIPRYQMRAAAR